MGTHKLGIFDVTSATKCYQVTFWVSLTWELETRDPAILVSSSTLDERQEGRVSSGLSSHLSLSHYSLTSHGARSQSYSL